MTRSGREGSGRRLSAELYTGPFHVVLRAAIRQRGLTLERLRVHLARRGITVGLSSLSNWQTGHTRPDTPGSLRAIRALEEILGLPPGSLVRLLPDADPGTRPGQERRGGVADIAPVAELLDAVPGAQDRDVELVSVQHKIAVDAQRRTTSMWSRTVVRALRDGVDRYLVRYYGNPGCVPSLVRPRPLGNCSLARFVPHPSAPALVYELAFGHELRAGETWVFECELVDPTAGVSREFAYGFRYPAEQYVLEVAFDPHARPSACYSFAQRDLSDERHPTGTLTLSTHNTVHLIASVVSSGVLGIRWEWP
ncbi:MAG: helix-turn-helix transcriptional regulator [Actinophytocola sp.]|uniref:helix-turn-helix domain-containing protein n=1 Tax=Actinophytocola sp. TaxID=1872138 RepID=UPI003C725341